MPSRETVGSTIPLPHDVEPELLDAMLARLVHVDEYPQLTPLPLRARGCTVVDVQATAGSAGDECPNEAFCRSSMSPPPQSD